MSDNTMNTLIISLSASVVASVIALLIEYLLIKPLGEAAPDKKAKLGSAILAVASFAIPVILLREFSLRVAAAIGQSFSIAARVEIYANVYAISASMWGLVWITKIRPWMTRRK